MSCSALVAGRDVKPLSGSWADGGRFLRECRERSRVSLHFLWTNPLLLPGDSPWKPGTEVSVVSRVSGLAAFCRSYDRLTY